MSSRIRRAGGMVASRFDIVSWTLRLDGSLFMEWQLHGVRLNTVHPASMACASGSTLYVDFPGYGLWMSGMAVHGARLNTVDPASMACTSGSTLYVDFAGYGLYSWNGSAWTQLNPLSIRRAGQHGSLWFDIVCGLSRAMASIQRNGSAWTQIHYWSIRRAMAW